VPAAKPQPDGLWQVCRDLNHLDPSECVYIGDSPSDGGAAWSAGMRFIGVTWGSHSRESLESAWRSEETSTNHHVVLCDSVSELYEELSQYAVFQDS